MKKCDDSEWSAAGFNSVSDCVDQSLDAPAGGAGGEGGEDNPFGDLLSLREAFVLSCVDFDKAAARKCLAGMRKVKRTCDDGAMSSDQEQACAEVCGTLSTSELFSNPTDLDLLLTVIEEEVGEEEVVE